MTVGVDAIGMMAKFIGAWLYRLGFLGRCSLYYRLYSLRLWKWRLCPPLPSLPSVSDALGQRTARGRWWFSNRADEASGSPLAFGLSTLLRKLQWRVFHLCFAFNFISMYWRRCKEDRHNIIRYCMTVVTNVGNRMRKRREQVQSLMIASSTPSSLLL